MFLINKKPPQIKTIAARDPIVDEISWKVLNLSLETSMICNIYNSLTSSEVKTFQRLTSNLSTEKLPLLYKEVQ